MLFNPASLQQLVDELIMSSSITLGTLLISSFCRITLTLRRYNPLVINPWINTFVGKKGQWQEDALVDGFAPTFRRKTPSMIRVDFFT